MADPSPADVAEPGTSPVVDEGKIPAEEGKAQSEEPKGRTYSEAYVKQLRTEAADGRNRISELEEKLQEHEDAGKSELEKWSSRATTAEQTVGELTTKLLRYEVAAASGLDLSAAAFLTGSTKEEIELRAEELGQLLQAKASGKPAAGFDGGARTTVPEKVSPGDAHNDFLLRAMGRNPERRAT